jgi:hypothetical protein
VSSGVDWSTKTCREDFTIPECLAEAKDAREFLREYPGDEGAEQHALVFEEEVAWRQHRALSPGKEAA